MPSLTIPLKIATIDRPVDIGDIVAYQGGRWRIHRVDSGVRTLVLLAWDGEKIEVPNDSPDLKHLITPSTWPFVATPTKVSRGPVKKLTLTRKKASLVLVPYEHWVPSDNLRAGGPLFLNPALRLRVGEILVATHSSKKLSRIPITKTFGSISKRERQAKLPQVQQTPTFFDRLDDD